jgi:hypothetical protein
LGGWPGDSARRDFSAASAIVAARYEVTAANAYAERARQLLAPR